MNIYKPSAPERAELCMPVNREDHELISKKICGAPQARDWTPIPLEIVHKDRGRKLTYSDAPWYMSFALVLRRPAVDKLRSLLEEYGELLPGACEEAELWFFNPTRVIDAMDEERSILRRFPDGRIMMVRNYAFFSEKVAGVEIFKVSNHRGSPTFVSDRVVEAWNAAGLRGLTFTKEWSG